jgi:1-deoxy-D-xylulose-5-phosphate synthase
MQLFSLLDRIEQPEDLRLLDVDQLSSLAEEIRLFLLESLHDMGGHLGAGLGVVELTVALHYVFNTPTDQIIWDVGHQAYPHKILTDRKHLFHTLRQKDGLAAFPRREESPYDAFGVGHSSTSISAAFGMAIAARHLGLQHHHIAVIGDGAMTAGMAFEALNHAGDSDHNLLVILNDNDMSISGNVGALSHYFSRILASKWYAHLRESGEKVLRRMPNIEEFARRTETHLKGMVAPGTIFEEMGFNYIGPIDGHDTKLLVNTLSNIKTLKGPQFLHIITRKGKGYAPAEADPIGYHAVSKGFYRRQPAKDFPTRTPILPATIVNPTFSDIFGEWLCAKAADEPRLYGITPAMCEGSGMVQFAQSFPDRYLDVGIAEQHSVTLAAGLACGQMRPVVAIYSTFLQRAYDQLIHDVAIQNLPVLFALDRAGLVPDGPTHSGNFDLSYLSCIPNMLVMAPSDENECWQMLTTGFEFNGPAAVRYPRGKGRGTPIQRTWDTLPIGKGRIIRKGRSIALLCFGTLLTEIEKVAAILDATVIDMRFIKPIDADLIEKMANTHDLIVTIEENVVFGGAGSQVQSVLSARQCLVHTLHLGLPDYFVEHATQEEMRASCGLNSEGLLHSIKQKVSKISCKNTAFPVEFVFARDED